jgi:hypothetical protein
MEGGDRVDPVPSPIDDHLQLSRKGYFFTGSDAARVSAHSLLELKHFVL